MLAIVAVTITGLLVSPLPVLAHHAMGGKTPTNGLTGFLSGLAHPLIGLDHLTFVIASGLLAALISGGFMIPIAFVLASLAGTGVHLISFDLPAPEFFISGSVLLFGILLAAKNHPHRLLTVGLAAAAGLFHGYAYGEAIVGAQMPPLVAYLLGFASVQMAIAFTAYGVGRSVLSKTPESPGLAFRFAGFAICGVGITFLSTVILKTLFPVT